MNPIFLDNMSWEMAEVYGAITDQILINLAHYFPYINADSVPRTAFEYQAAMLAQMGQVNRDTINIIRSNLAGADKALNGVLEQSVIDAVSKAEPQLVKAVKAGIFKPAGIPIVAPNQMRAFQLYYQQAAQKLNLVNTVMLESTKQAYQATVSDIANRVQVTQTALDTGAGETITGVSSWNQAVRHSINRMKANGITGFIDHAGHRWSAESYVAMDIRTTVYNTARSAVWETNQNFGNDLYIVSYHDGARPLCYPWQNKVISSTNSARTVTDLDGNEIPVYAQSDTSYGEAAGLFGINCKHYPSPFIPGVSVLYDQDNIPSEAENAKVYEQTQQQRGLERKLREEKRDLLMAKAQGAPPEEIKALREKCRKTSDDIDAFCEETGLPRRQNREGVYTKRDFPAADTYDVTAFERTQKEEIDKYFQGGGSQQGYSFGQMTPNNSNVAPQSTPAPQNDIQSSAETFIPARNRAEAEAYAKERFADSVTYNGSISVDAMNVVNKELTDLTDAYPIDKLRTIQQNGRMNALARANGGVLDVNGKKIDLDSDGQYALRQEHARKNLNSLKKRFPEGIPAAYRKAANEYEEILKYSRWTVDDNMKGAEKVRATIAHEYGHILADQKCGQINGRYFCKTYSEPETVAKRRLIESTFKKAKKTGDIYLLSEYGGTNSHEFFAETFSAFWTKQELPEYFYDMIRGVV